MEVQRQSALNSAWELERKTDCSISTKITYAVTLSKSLDFSEPQLLNSAKIY